MNEHFSSLVIMPTYNEKDNINDVIVAVLAVRNSIEILVVDDNSPDGTGRIVELLASQNPRIHLISRPGKCGLASAYLEGFEWGLERGFDVLVQMDADFSHQPKYLDSMIGIAYETHGACVGSRYISGGSVSGWSKYRVLISRSASIYARLVLGLTLRDLTSGYRAISRDALQRIDLKNIYSSGYGFQIEIMNQLSTRRIVTTEVPIEFLERKFGKSKMSLRIAIEAFITVLKLRISQELQK